MREKIWVCLVTVSFFCFFYGGSEVECATPSTCWQPLSIKKVRKLSIALLGHLVHSCLDTIVTDFSRSQTDCQTLQISTAWLPTQTNDSESVCAMSTDCDVSLCYRGLNSTVAKCKSARLLSTNDIALINHHPSATEAQFLFQICKGSIWTLKVKNVCELVSHSVNAISNMYPFDFKLIVE